MYHYNIFLMFSKIIMLDILIYQYINIQIYKYINKKATIQQSGFSIEIKK